MTKQLQKRFEKYPLYSQDGKGFDAIIQAYYFLPFSAATWLITEGSPLENGDYELYGYCTLNGTDWEWGYVWLSQIESVKLHGLKAERDRGLENIPIKEVLKIQGVLK